MVVSVRPYAMTAREEAASNHAGRRDFRRCRAIIAAMNVMLFGANGQLGSDLRDALTGHTLIAAARAPLNDPRHLGIQVDLADIDATRRVLETHRPQVVINCAAFHRVDDIETDAAMALKINALAAQQVARACRDIDCALLHVSTDYVFDGTKRSPYVEGDLPNPLSAYGASKLAGELLIRAAWPKHYIVRTCGLYGAAGASGKGGNFVNTMLRLAREGKPVRVVADQTCTPTATRDLAAQIAALIETGAYGTYHITNQGGCTWHEFASAIFELAGFELRPQAISSAEYNAPATRPPYSVLENAALQRLGIDRMPHWRDALSAYIADTVAS
jgi:dTDP-4-dehydrorhamnose reductase